MIITVWYDDPETTSREVEYENQNMKTTLCRQTSLRLGVQPGGYVRHPNHPQFTWSGFDRVSVDRCLCDLDPGRERVFSNRLGAAKWCT